MFDQGSTYRFPSTGMCSKTWTSYLQSRSRVGIEPGDECQRSAAARAARWRRSASCVAAAAARSYALRRRGRLARSGRGGRGRRRPGGRRRCAVLGRRPRPPVRLRGRAVNSADGDRAVGLGHRVRVDGEQQVVQGEDLRPVGLCGGGRLRVHGDDRRRSAYGPGGGGRSRRTRRARCPRRSARRPRPSDPARRAGRDHRSPVVRAVPAGAGGAASARAAPPPRRPPAAMRRSSAGELDRPSGEVVAAQLRVPRRRHVGPR